MQWCKRKPGSISTYFTVNVRCTSNLFLVSFLTVFYEKFGQKFGTFWVMSNKIILGLYKLSERTILRYEQICHNLFFTQRSCFIFLINLFRKKNFSPISKYYYKLQKCSFWTFLKNIQRVKCIKYRALSEYIYICLLPSAVINKSRPRRTILKQ